jgi:RND family efflux transporter MFP subunit
MEETKANIQSATAQRDQAKINLGYCTVYAPFSGRISRRYVDPGNSVMADNTILTTLVTEDPIYAYFDVDERTYLDLMNAPVPKQTSWFSGLQYPVLMRLSNEDEYVRVGKVDFIDNRVIATSGTVRMRGVFDNSKGILKPGLFVRIRLPIGQPYPAILIPDEALQSDQGRRYVYLVNDKDEVVYKQVKLGQAIQGLRVIKEGVQEGDRVIVSGVQRVRQGVQVQAKNQDPPAPPESALTRVLSAYLDHLKAGKSVAAD